MQNSGKAAPNPVEIDFFAQLAYPRALRVGPGGALLFALRRVQLQQNRYKEEVWLYKNRRLRRLRLPTGVQNQWWWEENTLLLATSGGPQAKKQAKKGLPITVLQTQPLAGGAGRELLRLHMAVEDAWPLPGGQLLLLAEWNPLVEKALAGAKGNAEKAAALLEKEQGCTVLEELPFWENGSGYVRGRHRLYLWDGDNLRPLTDETLEVEEVAPAPGGASVWLLAKEYGRAQIATTVATRLLQIELPGGAIADRSFWPLRHDALLPLPDGGALVAGSDMSAHGLNQNPTFYRLFADGSACILDDSGLYSLYSTVNSDVNMASFGRFLPFAGGAAFLSTREGSSHIMALDGGDGRPLLHKPPGPKIIRATSGPVVVFGTGPLGGRMASPGTSGTPGVGSGPNQPSQPNQYDGPLPKVEGGSISQITKTPGAVGEIAPAPGGFYAVALRGESAPEVYHIATDGTETRLTQFNEEACKNTRFAPFLPLCVQNEGRTVQGWVLLPTKTKAAKHPAILYVHGGPKTAYGPVLFHEMQFWAAQGYAVLLCNPSGSDGLGDDFADIRGDYGGRDSRDLLAFLDAALAQYPAINPARLGIAGGSYGGFMVNWLTGHSTRFAAAVSQRGIANWASMALLSDIGYYFVPDQAAVKPAEDGGDLLRRSPLAFAQNSTTPTLFLHSNEDYRCPLAEGLQQYSLLKLNGVPCRMVVFHGENHELSRRGRPQNRLRRLQEMAAWFGRYL